MAVSIQNVVVYASIIYMSRQAHFCADVLGHVQTMTSPIYYLILMNPGTIYSLMICKNKNQNYKLY